MWIRFDGEKTFVKADNWNDWKILKEFTLERWVHITETNDKLYMDGEEI